MIHPERVLSAFVAFVLSGLAACLIGCDASSGSSSPENVRDDSSSAVVSRQDDTGIILDRSEAEITVSGDILTIHAGETLLDTTVFCTYSSTGGDTLVTVTSTIHVPERKYRWSVQGDTLKLSELDTMRTSNDTIPFLDQLQYVHQTGTGLYGRFRSIRVVRLPLQTVPANSPDTIFFALPQELSTRHFARTIEIVGNRIKYETRLIVSWADYSIDMLKLYHEDLQADYTKIDDRTFLITGRITKEVVRMKLVRSDPVHPLDGDVEFSSDNASHPAFVQYMIPTSCPDVSAWYLDFLKSNKIKR